MRNFRELSLFERIAVGITILLSLNWSVSRAAPNRHLAGYGRTPIARAGTDSAGLWLSFTTPSRLRPSSSHRFEFVGIECGFDRAPIACVPGLRMPRNPPPLPPPTHLAVNVAVPHWLLIAVTSVTFGLIQLRRVVRNDVVGFDVVAART